MAALHKWNRKAAEEHFRSHDSGHYRIDWDALEEWIQELLLELKARQEKLRPTMTKKDANYSVEDHAKDGELTRLHLKVDRLEQRLERFESFVTHTLSQYHVNRSAFDEQLLPGSDEDWRNSSVSEYSECDWESAREV